MPRVSIITPCYNSAAFIGQTVESCLAQTFQDWQLIVVNDGSTDTSKTIIESCLKRDRRIRLIDQSNGGVCRARNAGYAAASPESEYVLFLDADDCLMPQMLSAMTAYMDENPDTGLLRCGYHFMDEHGHVIDFDDAKVRYASCGVWVRTIPQSEPQTPFESIYTLCGIIPSIALIRRSVYEKSPGWDESFGHHHEDANLFLHLGLYAGVHFYPQKLVLRRRHSAQNTSGETRKDFLAAQEEKLYQRWLSGEGLNAEQRRVVKKAEKFRSGRLEPYLAFKRAKGYLQEGKILTALRFYFGGARRWLGSFFL